MQRNVRRQDGAAATEFALVAPILILLFFGIVYFGLHIYRQQVVESATREAARFMAVGGDLTDIETALDQAGSGFTDAELQVVRFERLTEAGVITSSANAPFAGTETPCSAGTDYARVITNASGTRLNFTVPFYSGGEVVASYDATATFRCESS